jgi:hypothetical protein
MDSERPSAFEIAAAERVREMADEINRLSAELRDARILLAAIIATHGDGNPGRGLFVHEAALTDAPRVLVRENVPGGIVLRVRSDG